MRKTFKLLLSTFAAFSISLAGCLATTFLFMAPLTDTFTVVVSMVASLSVVYPLVIFYRERFDELFDVTFPKKDTN